ncbi:DUF7344 domain-containing protein [Haloplanus salilacus]|uniref:DUF7344 domain-containing protein n=1 Tax=Haloplanus salilacus TaxID=2949994 RepID=UPI0030D34819
MPPNAVQMESNESTDHEPFATLRNGRRREVIDYLRDRPGPVDLRDLSEHVAAVENDCDPADVTYDQRKRVQTALYQMHLPKLADAGVVSYDRRAGEVTLVDGAERCLPYLDAVDERRRRWWRWYLLVAAILAVPIALAAAGVGPFTRVPGLAYATVAVLSCAFVSLVQVAVERD